MPSTFVAGFQHGAMYPMLLCNFVPPRELAIAPLPDRVVCNGPAFREIVVREGLPRQRVVAGPALRYRHLREVATAHGDRILVPLPMMLMGVLVSFIQAFVFMLLAMIYIQGSLEHAH